jgi:hypothetical protein
LICRLLINEPDCRLDAAQALNHPFMTRKRA